MSISWRQWIGGVSLAGKEPLENDQLWIQKPAASLVATLGKKWVDSDFQPTDADKKSAWVFYNQLRSRIVTRPLPYLDGDEKTALTSVYDLFALARKVCEDSGPDGSRFSDLVWTMLNHDVRPLTAKWHKRFVNGKLKEDDRHEFREELEKVQETVRYFEQLLLALSREDKIEIPPEQEASSLPMGLTDPVAEFPFNRDLRRRSVSVHGSQ